MLARAEKPAIEHTWRLLKKTKQLLLCKPESRHVNRRQDLALLKKNKKTPLFQCGQVLGSLSYKD